MNRQAALLKREIEAKLANRIPAALSPVPQQAAHLHPLGHERIDTLLGGGLPLGSVCEITGPEGSGHCSLAFSLLASASAEGACAYIDVNDMLSPKSAAAAGITLANLLWVRFPAGVPMQMPAVSSSTGFPPSGINARDHRPLHGGCGSSHPRGETKGLAPALEEMLFYKEERRRRKMEGTPGHPNQPLGLHTASQDQVDWERWNLRKADETDPLRQIDRKAADAARLRASSSIVALPAPVENRKGWDRLSGALRATDQVLQSGGFRVIVLDLASVAAEQALRIPSATWFRFRRAAQESDAILLLLTREPCARSSAACVLECSANEPQGSKACSRRLRVLRRLPASVPDRPWAKRHRAALRTGLQPQRGCVRWGDNVSFAAIYIPEFVDKVIHPRAKYIKELDVTTAPMESHDFH